MKPWKAMKIAHRGRRERRRGEEDGVNATLGRENTGTYSVGKGSLKGLCEATMMARVGQG